MAAAYGLNPSQAPVPPSSSPSGLPAAQPEEASEKHSKPLRILLVEDNSADVLVIRDVLEQQGFNYELTTASDGQQAIAILNETDRDAQLAPFDLALIDLNLPKYNGHEVLARLRQTSRSGEIPALIVTSSSSPSDFARAKELGATDYFRKPPTLDEYARLGEMIRRALPHPLIE